MEENKKYACDGVLLGLVILLSLIGLVFLYSTSSYNGSVRFGDKAYYFKKQIFAAGLGFCWMYVISRGDYHKYVKYAYFIYGCSLVLSALVLVIGKEYNGSKRWLAIGPLSFQPAEFAKIAVILFLGKVIGQTRKNTSTLWFMIRTMLLVLPVVGLVGINNLSTAIIILGIAVILIFVSNPRYWPFVGVGVVGIGFIAVFLGMESYRLERLAIWRNPEKFEKGFQTIQGLYAIGSGGIFGKGLGKSMQKLGFVPEAQNDMVFSIICEEMGLFGAAVLICLFGILIWRLAVNALAAKDLVGALLCTGIMAHMALQVILNIAVVTNSIPNTGITLPFVSFGGTSVLFLLSEMGVALSVSRYGIKRNK